MRRVGSRDGHRGFEAPCGRRMVTVVPTPDLEEPGLPVGTTGWSHLYRGGRYDSYADMFRMPGSGP